MALQLPATKSIFLIMLMWSFTFSPETYSGGTTLLMDTVWSPLGHSLCVFYRSDWCVWTHTHTVFSLYRSSNSAYCNSSKPCCSDCTAEGNCIQNTPQAFEVFPQITQQITIMLTYGHKKAGSLVFGDILVWCDGRLEVALWVESLRFEFQSNQGGERKSKALISKALKTTWSKFSH